MRYQRTAARPIGEINTTPLIDVMLVLLIMFIIVIPAITHKVPLQLPPGGPPDGPPTATERLDMGPTGALYWNGEAIERGALGARLETLLADPAEPLLVVRADGEATYNDVDHMLADVARAGVTRMAFSGNGDFARAF